MTVPAPNPEDRSTKEGGACVICGCDLKPSALRCNECGYFQSVWRRWLGGFDIGALTTLLPVITLCAAFLNTQLVQPRTELSSVLQRCTRDGLQLALMNMGSAPAIIASITIQESIGERPSGVAVGMVAQGDPEQLILAPGAARALRFSPVDSSGAATRLPVRIGGGACDYLLSISYRAFQSRDLVVRTERVSCPCAA
jgi:hypothetical protein